MADRVNMILSSFSNLSLELPKDSANNPHKHKVIKSGLLFDLFENDPCIVKYETLDTNSQEYINIGQLCYPLSAKRIDKVLNQFNTMSFSLKKYFLYNDQHTKMFHGTKRQYVDGICENNFDWRLSGKSRGHKHGYGVNFTQSSYFAGFFTERSGTKVIIVADVLCNKTFMGNCLTRVPPEGYDTSVRHDHRVYVKFDDAEFNPKYVIYYD